MRRGMGRQLESAAIEVSKWLKMNEASPTGLCIRWLVALVRQTVACGGFMCNLNAPHHILVLKNSL